MAEIRVQKKKGIPVWAILLGLILLALLIWAYLRMRGNDVPEAPSDQAVLEWTAPALVGFSFPEARCA
ncbi:MAG TPA: hypothetical protein VKK31_05460 [Thermoanaerobaculia bacterium]|nr:hypothetical protein [Thermoanaerobaculia bacterium]